MQRNKLLPIILLVFVVGIVTVLALILLDVIPGRKPPRIPKTTLEVWGVVNSTRTAVFDSPRTFQEFTEEFTGNDFYKNVTIRYTEKFLDEYEDDLLNALAEGRGPDIFMVHNSWLPKHRTKIDPLPMEEYLWKGSILGPIGARDFQTTFVDVAYKDFVKDQKVYALPLYVDTLALYYNKDMFNTAGIPIPPSTWEDLETTARTLTRKDAEGNILRSGITMGSAKNVNASTDILSILFLQNGNPIVDLASGTPQPTLLRYGASDVLDFYTSFARKGDENYMWDSDGHYSIDAFSWRESAMMINYSHHARTLRKKDPSIRFDVAPIPQPKDSQKAISYANYWGLAVSATSAHKNVAHEFIRWASQKESQMRFLELTGHPTARRDLVLWQGTSYPDLEVFVKQALQAESWYQPDSRRVETIFEDMIESVVSGALVFREALERAENELQLLIR